MYEKKQVTTMKDGGESLVVVRACAGGTGMGNVFTKLECCASICSTNLTHSCIHAQSVLSTQVVQNCATMCSCSSLCSYWVDFVYFTTFAWIQIQIGLIWKRWVSLTLSSSLYIHKVNYLYFLHQMCIQRVCNQIIYEMLRMLLFPTLWMMKISHGQTDPRALLLVLVELDC